MDFKNSNGNICADKFQEKSESFTILTLISQELRHKKLKGGSNRPPLRREQGQVSYNREVKFLTTVRVFPFVPSVRFILLESILDHLHFKDHYTMFQCFSIYRYRYCNNFQISIIELYFLMNIEYRGIFRTLLINQDQVIKY